MTENYFKTSSLVQLSCDCEGAFMGSCSRRTLLATVTMAAMVIAGGCQMPPSPSTITQSQPVPAPIAKVSQQLIIKFKPDTIVCDAAGIARLSSTMQVLLEHIRPMSGDACVVKQFADNTNGLSQGQNVLRQHPAIEWLEEDRMMKAF